MAELTGSYVSIDESNITTSKSSVQQLIDIVQSDVSNLGGENTRKKYQVFVSGGANLTSITSSLYQTVFDQDFTLGTSNSLFDVTVGSFLGGTSSAPIVNSQSATFDAGGKLIFSSGDGSNNNDIAMMREKVSIYRQFAQNLIGDPNAAFVTPHYAEPIDNPASGTDPKKIDAAIFLSFKRLFTRDNIFKGSFGLKLYKDAAGLETDIREINIAVSADEDANNNSAYLIDDTLSASNIAVDPIGGELSTLTDNLGNYVGLIFYDKGIIVLDAERTFNCDQFLRGVIFSTNSTAATISAQNAVANETPAFSDDVTVSEGEQFFRGKFYPDLWVSGTIDQVVDHICDSRFGTGTLSSIGFRNETIINSSLVFCRAAPSQLNYSTNPTCKDAEGNLIAINPTTKDTFSFITTVGLYDADGFLLAVAKTSRPIEKNPETDLSIRIRLDY